MISAFVSMITYNQRDFVEEAIDSVLEQKADFRIVLHIGDDCSTDGTREILLRYRDRYSDRIVLNLATKRGGGRTGRRNNIHNINSCRHGDYIALLDGDDYWTDPNKLQRQVDFLERHPGYSAAGHDARFLEEPDGRLTGCVSDAMHQLVGLRRGDTSDVDLDQSRLFRFMPQTSTLCLRTSALPRFPDWFLHVPAADRAIAMLVAERGPIHFDRRVMSIYRLHAASEWQTITKGPSHVLRTWDDATFDHLLGAFPAANRGRNRAQYELLKMKHRFADRAFGRAAVHAVQAVRHHLPTVATTGMRALRRLRLR